MQYVDFSILYIHVVPSFFSSFVIGQNQFEQIDLLIVIEIVLQICYTGKYS